MEFSQNGNLYESSIKIAAGVYLNLEIFNTEQDELKCPIQCLINNKVIERCVSIGAAKEYFRNLFKNFATNVLEYTIISEISTAFLEVIYDNNGNYIMQRISKNGITAILRPTLFIETKNFKSNTETDVGHKEYELIMSNESFSILVQENEMAIKKVPILEEIKRAFSKRHYNQLLRNNIGNIYRDQY